MTNAIDESTAPRAPGQQYLTDSSQVLLGLLTLADNCVAQERAIEDDTGDVIARPALTSLLSALHFRDVATVEHARRVAMLSLGMASQIGWSDREKKILEVAALLHDIGKIGVPDSILFKPSSLSPEEAELMSLHYYIANDVLQAYRVDSEVLEIVRQCHEHYDRVGYDSQRVGSDVHMGARILAVADAYDSLATEQVYRKAKPHDEIMQILMLGAGTQFDGNIICSLARWVEDGRVPTGMHLDSRGLLPSEVSDRAFRGDSDSAGALCHIFAYLHLLENLYDGFYLINEDQRFVVWNRGAENLLGHKSHHMLNNVWSNKTLSYCNDKGKPLSDKKCPLFKALADKKPVTSSITMLRLNGEAVDVEVQSVPLIDSNGALKGVAEIFRNLSRDGKKSKQYRELQEAASRDPLTSTANRGEMERQLEQTLADVRDSKNAESFCVIFIDVDYFKNINDDLGHTVGDDVLVELAKLLQNETYSGELVARYGGEEFVIICPDTNLDQGYKRAERLRIAASKLKVPSLGGRKLTASLGVTVNEEGDTVPDILSRADKALYEAKGAGRNTTRVFANEEVDLESQLAEVKQDEEKAEAFLFKGKFQAVVASDMLVYKLAGFVDDFHAKIMEVEPERVVIRVGQRGVIPGWGSHESKQPVNVEVVIGKEEAPQPGKKRARAKRVDILVTMRPLGWIRKKEVFQHRAANVYKDLKSYFIADMDLI